MKSRSQSLRRFWIGLAIAVAFFAFATIPYLGDYPAPDWSEMGIAAPAFKLATEGVYGNDLFTGFHSAERFNYEYMPAYPLLVAASFKMFGLGVSQARMVSVAAGVAVLLLSFWLGCLLGGPRIGLFAVASLSLLKLGVAGGSSGIPLIDFSRVVRYDILVPVFVLAATICFLSTLGRQPNSTNGLSDRLGMFLTGVLAGLATLSHLYGAFILIVFAGVLIGKGPRLAAVRHIGVIAIGWSVAVSPWLIYIAQDFESFVGQMSRHVGRFDILDPRFYVENLLNEHHRYSAWAGSFPEGLWLPRVGFWVLVVGVGIGGITLIRRYRRLQTHGDMFLLISLPAIALFLGLFLSLKRVSYTGILLPFLALYVAVALETVGKWASRSHGVVRRGIVVLVVSMVAVEGLSGVALNLAAARSATPYRELTATIGERLDVDARLLISQPMWMGLAEFETRSLNLVFAHTFYDSRDLETVMAEIGTDVVIVERHLLYPAAVEGLSPHAASVAEWWNAFRRYLEIHCPEILATLTDPAYGTIDVFECQA